MSNIIYVDALITKALNLDNTPLSQQTFQAADIVEFMDDELQTNIVAEVNKVREEYFVTNYDVTVTSDTPYVDIPGESIGLALRDVFLTDSTGNLTGRCKRLDPDEIGTTTGGLSPAIPFSFPFAMQRYYIANNRMFFTPRIQGTQNIRLRYFLHPNNLCLQANSGVILTKNGGNQVSLNNADPVWVIGTQLDFLVPTIPFQFRVVAATITDITGFSITLDAASYAQVQVGDICAATTFAPVVQFFSRQVYPLLAQAVSTKILAAQADMEALQVSQAKYTQLLKNFISVISPKVQSDARAIKNPNSPFNFGRSSRYFW